MNQPIIAQAPATIANVGPGFDALGFAFDGPSVSVTLSPAQRDGIVVTSDADLPSDPTQNTASVAVQAVCDQANITPAIALHIDAGIPIGSGLGSSAASAVAGAVAANAYYELSLADDAMLRCALAGEAAVSGAAHADNVAPAYFGGLGIVRTHDPVDWIVLPPQSGLQCVAVYPEIQVKTAEARKVLPQSVSLTQAVQHASQLAALVAGFATEDASVIACALDDRLIEPRRAELITGYAAVKKSALQSGALTCAIAGSGPTLFSFIESSSNPKDVERAMIDAFREHHIKARGWVGAILPRGAHIVR